jgi:type I restriction enzyme S subunit
MGEPASRKWRSYPAYKTSNVEWLGHVPTHWRVERLKTIASLVTTRADHSNFPVALENIESGTGGFIQTDSEFEGDGIAFRPGDVLFGKLRPYLAKAWLADQAGEAVGDIFTLRPGRHILGEYLRNLLLAPSVIAILDGSTFGSKMPRVSWDFLSTLRIPVPPLKEQQTICSFLACEAQSIDALISKQERLINVLTERRQSLIHQAVTRGLDRSAPMEDSGVPWIGKAPAHWSVRRIKDVSRLESGHTPSKTVPEYWVDCTIPWVSLNDSKQLATTDYITETAVQISQLGLDNSSARLLPAEAVAFTRDATIGLAAITTRPMAVSQHIIAWVPTGKVLPLFLLRVLNAMRPFLDFYTAGATIKTIGMEDIRKLTMAVPPLPEQQQILDALEPELQAIDTLANKCRRAIELLHEHRASLISAVVTGKIRVTEDVPAAEELLAA